MVHCSFEGCTRPVQAKGLCQAHYRQSLRKVDLTPIKDDGTAYPKECAVTGCTTHAFSRGWCQRHYSRWTRYGDPGEAEYRRRVEPLPCRVDGCENRATTFDLCPTHRRRERLYGDPLATFESRRRCVVDGCDEVPVTSKYSSDHCRQHYVELIKSRIVAGQITRKTEPSTGYVYHSIFKKTYAEHAIVMEHHIGRPLLPMENVHHRNGVRHDNRIENLELWVKPQPAGQRVEDLVAWVVATYPQYVKEALGLVE